MFIRATSALALSAAVNFDDFSFLFAQFDSESYNYIDYKADRIISGMHKKYL